MSYFLRIAKTDDAIPAEVIQKLGALAAVRVAARAAARKPGVAVRDFQRGYRIANRARNMRGLSHAERRNIAMDHYRITTREGRASALGARASDAVATARARGQRVGQRLREGYANGVRGTGRNQVPLRGATLRRYPADFRAAHAAGSAVRGGRVWVTNARVAGGGFWRRVSGA